MTNIDESTTVRDLVTAYPAVFAVLERHGMCSDCRIDPPAVPLSHFANKHCGGDLEGLLVEVRTAMDAGK